MRQPVVPCLLLVAACASGGQTAAPGTIEPPRPVEVSTSPDDASVSLSIRREANIVTATLAAPGDRLWPMLVMVFDELGLPVTSTDAANRVLQSATGKRTTSIAGQRIARFFECPATGYGNSAQGQDTYITLQAQLLPRGEGGTELRMQTQANVVLNGAAVGCRTTARLEQRIAEDLARKAGLQ
jgi:hypothetical protein